MASYPPPIDNVGIFDTELFKSQADAALTINQADKRYLRFPNAQGTETLQDVVINGSTTAKERVYQEINPDPSWNSVNGYYALDKDKMCLPDPTSAGVKAVSIWNARAAPLSIAWGGIAWSPQLGLFAAVAGSATATTSKVMTSPDGINWTERTIPTDASGVFFSTITWSPEYGYFLASGSVSVSPTYFIRSSDGITWTSQSISTNQVRGLTWSPELRVFVTAGNGNFVSSSSDGGVTLTWTNNGLAGTYNDVIWSPELKIFLAIAGNIVAVSSTGAGGWVTTVVASTPFLTVAWSPQLNLFAAGCTAGSNKLVTSPDGITWTDRTSPYGSAQAVRKITWADELGLFIGVSEGGRIFSSPDGTTWTARTPPAGFTFYNICWSPELGIAVAPNFTASLTNGAATSNLLGRPPTSYNVFDTSFNNIDQSGNWQLKTRSLYTDTGSTITTSNRINQVINTGSTWDAVNGCYALDKEKMNLLDPRVAGVKAVTTWNLRTTPAPDVPYRAITWASRLGLFLAVGNTTDIVTSSSNGINWISNAVLPLSASWTNIVWANEISTAVAINFNAVNPLQLVAYSSNGTTWSNASISGVTTSTWVGLTWSPELRLFVSVADAGTSRVMTSPDGINWTIRTPANTNAWAAVTWSPELSLFVAVSYSASTSNVMTSPDGITWTARTTPNTNGLLSVCWSPQLSLFVAVALSGTGNRVTTSPDGITWTARTSAADYAWNQVTWIAELGVFVACANTAVTDNIMYSVDGITWTLAIGPNTNQLRCTAWSPELGLAATVAFTGTLNRVITSTLLGRPPTSYNVFDTASILDYARLPDPTSFGVAPLQSWSNAAAPVVASNAYQSVCSIPQYPRLVAVASSGTVSSQVITSDDGITWAIKTAAANNQWRSVAWSYSLNRLVAVADSGATNRVMTSNDFGDTWVTRSTIGLDNLWNSVVWAAELNLFVAVAGSGTQRVMTSPDGITWTGQTAAQAYTWNSVCWSPELSLFVAVSTAATVTDKIMTSPNGINWTSRNMPATPALNDSWQSVCWSAELGLFVACSNAIINSSRIITSPDGIKWTSYAVSTSDNWKSICWSKELGIFLVAGLLGDNLTSVDGVTWVRRAGLPNHAWQSVCWSAEFGIFAVVGASAGSGRTGYSALNGRYITPFNMYRSPYNSISQAGDWTMQGVSFTSPNNVTVGSTAGNTIIRTNQTLAGGTIALSGGTGLLAATAGGSAGQHLVITINGNTYKIALLLV